MEGYPDQVTGGGGTPAKEGPTLVRGEAVIFPCYQAIAATPTM